MGMPLHRRPQEPYGVSAVEAELDREEEVFVVRWALHGTAPARRVRVKLQVHDASVDAVLGYEAVYTSEELDAKVGHCRFEIPAPPALLDAADGAARRSTQDRHLRPKTEAVMIFATVIDCDHSGYPPNSREFKYSLPAPVVTKSALKVGRPSAATAAASGRDASPVAVEQVQQTKGESLLPSPSADDAGSFAMADELPRELRLRILSWVMAPPGILLTGSGERARDTENAAKGAAVDGSPPAFRPDVASAGCFASAAALLSVSRRWGLHRDRDAKPEADESLVFAQALWLWFPRADMLSLAPSASRNLITTANLSAEARDIADFWRMHTGLYLKKKKKKEEPLAGEQSGGEGEARPSPRLAFFEILRSWHLSQQLFGSRHSRVWPSLKEINEGRGLDDIGLPVSLAFDHSRTLFLMAEDLEEVLLTAAMLQMSKSNARESLLSVSKSVVVVSTAMFHEHFMDAHASLGKSEQFAPTPGSRFAELAQRLRVEVVAASHDFSGAPSVGPSKVARWTLVVFHASCLCSGEIDGAKLSLPLSRHDRSCTTRVAVHLDSGLIDMLKRHSQEGESNSSDPLDGVGAAAHLTSLIGACKSNFAPNGPYILFRSFLDRIFPTCFEQIGSMIGFYDSAGDSFTGHAVRNIMAAQAVFHAEPGVRCFATMFITACLSADGGGLSANLLEKIIAGDKPVIAPRTDRVSQGKDAPVISSPSSTPSDSARTVLERVEAALTGLKARLFPS